MSGRILVVDDDAAVLRTLVTAMIRSGHQALSANNVAGAVALVASAPDVVLVDFHIGTESGLDVVRACREQLGHHVAIFLLTGEDDDDTRMLASEAGADLVLAKPVSPSELRKHVGQALTNLHSSAA
jgi:DNA-binding response OmpR family regulator